MTQVNRRNFDSIVVGAILEWTRNSQEENENISLKFQTIKTQEEEKKKSCKVNYGETRSQ